MNSSKPYDRLGLAMHYFLKVFIAALAALVPATARAERIWFPPDAGVVDVTKEPYSAKPDDGLDDTAAIQQALNDHPSGNHVFYFPKGVYDISDALLKLPQEDALRNTRCCLELRGSMKRNIFIGESEAETILRLMDSVPEDFSGGMIWFGPRPAQRFRNAVRNMTISTGVSHPQASGILFNASNQGGLRNVTIRSDDPEHLGAVGLHLTHTDEIGPLLVQNVTVDGFDRGIRCAYQTASQTFEHIKLRNQREYGWTNGFSQSIFVRGLDYQGHVTAVRSGPTLRGDPGQAKLLLVDADLRFTGDTDPPIAVRNQKVAFLRNVRADGFRAVVTRELDHGRGNPTVVKSPLEEFIANGSGARRSGAPFMLFESREKSLNLPVEEPPKIEWEQDAKNWRSPLEFAKGNSGKPDDAFDDTPSIQAAIDSGATTVYLPRGTWRIDGELLLRGNVRHFVGCEARLNPVERGRVATVVLDKGNSPAVLVEGLEAGGMRFTHRCQRTLHMRHILGCSYRAPKIGDAGDLFLTDVVSGPITVAKGQRLWARQLNIEGDATEDTASEAKVLNAGGTVWILGMKTEDAGTAIKTVADGRTELLGHIHIGHTGDAPCFVTIDSAFSAAVTSAAAFPIAAAEERNGERRIAEDFRMADLYVATKNRDTVAP